jgi:hypothetical protein
MVVVLMIAGMLQVSAQQYRFEDRLKMTFFGDFSKNLYDNLFVQKKGITSGVTDALVGAALSSVCYESAIEIINKQPDKAICSQLLFEKSRHIKSLAVCEESMISSDILIDQVLFSWSVNYLFFKFNISRNPGFKLNQTAVFPLASYGAERILAPSEYKPGFGDMNWDLTLKSGVFILGEAPYNRKCLMTEGGNLVIGR